MYLGLDYIPATTAVEKQTKDIETKPYLIKRVEARPEAGAPVFSDMLKAACEKYGEKFPAQGRTRK